MVLLQTLPLKNRLCQEVLAQFLVYGKIMARLQQEYCMSLQLKGPISSAWYCQEILCETSSPSPCTVPEMADAFHITRVQVKSTDLRSQNWNSEQPPSSRLSSVLGCSRTDFQPTFSCSYAITCLLVCHNYLYKCTYTSINQKGYLLF